MPIIWIKPTIESHKEKFLRNVARNEQTGCLEWTAGKTATGYGQFVWGGAEGGPANTTSHRAAWWIFKGSIPEGLVLCHKCNNRLCVETERDGHVYLGTQQRNMQDRLESGRNPSTYRHYNWKSTDELADRIMAELQQDKTIEEVCVSLDIGRTTFYRLRDHHQKIRDLINANKIWHYQRGSRNGGSAKMSPRMMVISKREISAGGSLDDICHRIGTTKKTLRNWADRFPELATLIATRPRHG